MLVLGIMSGTSIDGVDYALCDVQRRSIKLKRLWHRRFPGEMGTRLHAAAANQCSAHELAQLHHDLGRLYARQALALRCKLELVGLHGQTVFHNATRAKPATLQIGEPAYLARALAVPVINNFRAADLATGGQGAPLATGFHRLVFAQKGSHTCINNLGGISNVTSLDWRKGELKVTAFDTGPANVLLDLACRELGQGGDNFDTDGRIAAKGTVQEPVLQSWLRHPFFQQRPPKSTGREVFGERFWHSAGNQLRPLSKADALATLSEFTARSIILNYRLHLPSMPKRVVLCGGGARNSDLVRRIRAGLSAAQPETAVLRSDELGWPAESVEASAFALLAYLRLHEIPGNVPSTTGAISPAILGQIAVAQPLF